MNKIFLISLLGVSLLFSCNNRETKPEKTIKDSLSIVKNFSKPVKKVALKKLIFDANQLLTPEKTLLETKLKGNLVAGVRWEDVNGGNIVFFTEAITDIPAQEGPGAADKELHAYHYKYTGEKYELVREVKDFEKNCGFEMRARFMESSITVTDLDTNGYAELTFVYRLGCTSELSPDGLKLIMLENGKKYAIRGNTTVNYGNSQVGGRTKIDSAFKNAPKVFLEFAKKIWKKNQKHNLANKARKYMIEKLIIKYGNAKLSGVEPFWSIKFNQNELVYSSPGFGDMKFEYIKVMKIVNGYRVETERLEKETTTYLRLTVTDENCNDGMSEKIYPIKIEGTFNNQKLDGCGWIKK